jgi:hypothetical protein
MDSTNYCFRLFTYVIGELYLFFMPPLLNKHKNLKKRKKKKKKQEEEGLRPKKF